MEHNQSKDWIILHVPSTYFSYNMIMWIVYLIKHNQTGEIYIGFTNNLKARLSAHNNGQNKSTKRLKGKWVLIYAEAYRSELDARDRERKLKQYGQSKQRLQKRISRSLGIEISAG